MAAQFAVGMSMAQQMMQQTGGIQAQSTPAAAPPASAPVTASPPGLLSPADAAKVLGVGESDVLAALGDGSLKGKKIGTAWRITRNALDEFLKS